MILCEELYIVLLQVSDSFGERAMNGCEERRRIYSLLALRRYDRSRSTSVAKSSKAQYKQSTTRGSALGEPPSAPAEPRQ